jgi:hypothetical protein
MFNVHILGEWKYVPPSVEIIIPVAGGMLVWTPDLAYPCVLEQPAKDEYEVVG